MVAIAAVTVLVMASALMGCGKTGSSSTEGTTSSPSERLAAPTSSASAPAPSSTLTRPCSNQSVVATWPIARRAAQLVVAPVLNFNTATIRVATAAGAGGVLFLGSASAPANLAVRLHASVTPAAPGPAPMVMVDQEGGGVQRLGNAVPSMPWPRTMAQTLSPDQVQTLATTVGNHMRELGVDVNLAPVVDLDAGRGPSATDPDGQRSFSALPATTASYGVAFVHGMQAAGVVPVVKHFPGLGGASGNTDYGPATTQPLSDLKTTGLIPFQAAIAAGAPAVMVANATVPGLTNLPASLSPAAIDGLLRHDLGFSGLVLTDSLSAGAITQAGYQLPEAAVAAISAGADMILFGSTLTVAQTQLLSPFQVAATIGHIVDAIVAATSKGTIPVSRLDDAVSHVLAVKHAQLCGA
jgi:beta-N-acetylhexosaminidase